MNIRNLKVGMNFKNYKVLCEALYEKPKSGGSKKIQISNWRKYFEFKKRKNAYKITEIYDDNKRAEIEYKIKVKNAFMDKQNKQLQFKVKDEHYFSAGVYGIILCNVIYIGSTKCFINRYKTHYMKNNENLPTREMLYNGATFITLWVYTEPHENIEVFNNILLLKEKEIIQEYEQNENYVIENKVYPIGSKQYNARLKPRENKKQYTNIRIPMDKYEEVMEYLINNNIVDK